MVGFGQSEDNIPITSNLTHSKSSPMALDSIENNLTSTAKDDPIQCYVRIRPINHNELRRGGYSCLEVLRDKRTIQVFICFCSTVT